MTAPDYTPIGAGVVPAQPDGLEVVFDRDRVVWQLRDDGLWWCPVAKLPGPMLFVRCATWDTLVVKLGPLTPVWWQTPPGRCTDADADEIAGRMDWNPTCREGEHRRAIVRQVVDSTRELDWRRRAVPRG